MVEGNGKQRRDKAELSRLLQVPAHETARIRGGEMKSAKMEKAGKILLQAKKVAVFSGAGLSAESGIPTFRDKDPEALWARFDPMELASVQGFLSNPQQSLEWYNWRRKLLSEKSPNPGHLALAKKTEWVQITQNVDHLLEEAGVSPDKVLHLHGEIAKDRCHKHCGFEEDVELDNPPGLRECPRCGGLVRPGVVLFGEMLPQKIFNEAEKICSSIDALLVVGTSAQVYPAAGLIQVAALSGAQIIIVNKDPSLEPQEMQGVAELTLSGSSGEILPQLIE